MRIVAQGTVPQKKTVVTMSESMACPATVEPTVRVQSQRPPVQSFILAMT